MNAALGGPEPAVVVAVVVTLGPDDRLPDRLAALRGQVAGVVVVDNGSGPASDQVLARVAAGSTTEIIRNSRNLGIAAALNQGLARAAEKGAQWALTLDQDTTPLADLVAAATRTYLAYPDREHLAVVAGTQLGHRPPPAPAGRPWAEVPALITAGSIVSLAVYRAIGPFREDFFVDYVDIEFCLRARRAGFRIVQGTSPTIDHRIGAPTSSRLGFRAVTPTNHSPARRYYITRNRIRVWAGYGLHEPRYVGTDMAAAVKELVKLVLFEDRRAAKLESMARAIRDALLGRTGPAPARRKQL